MTAARPWMRSFILVVCSLTSSCNGVLDVPSLRLADGMTVRELTAVSDTAVVMIADPGDCFVCSAAVGEWATRRAAKEVSLLLILTREPTQAERKQLAGYRLPVAGIVAPSLWPRRLRSMEYLFVGGHAVMADTLRSGRYSSAVLHWARTRTPN